jgi:hypothetical protein
VADDVVDIGNRIQLRSNRREDTAPSSKEIIPPPPSLLNHLHTLVSHIIRVATYFPHVLEEIRKTLLARGSMVVTRARSRTRSTVRIMSSLGANLNPRSDHPWNILISATKRHSVGLHLKGLSTHHTIRGPFLDQMLDILAIVGSHTLHGGSLDFLKDEVTTMNLPEFLGLAIVYQILVVAPDTRIISSLAHKIATKELRKSIVVVVHP